MADIYYTELDQETFDRLFECLPPAARLTDPSYPNENLMFIFPGGRVIIRPVRKEENGT